MSLRDEKHVLALIEAAKREDLGAGDVTAALLEEPAAIAEFSLVAKQTGVLACCEIVEAVLASYDPAIELTWESGIKDGSTLCDVPCQLAVIRGPLGTVLAAERVALNFLQRLCGVASLTHRFVNAIQGTSALIYDTRKTTPGWRVLERSAVRCGGGHNHREGLFDAVLIKDNHIAGVPPQRLATTIFAMLNRIADGADRPKFVEVEVDTLEQAGELFKVVGIDVVLLDNFSLDDLAAAVALRNGLGLSGKIALEASGGVTLEAVHSVALTGVDRIAVGALTHSAAALDISLERV